MVVNYRRIPYFERSSGCAVVFIAPRRLVIRVNGAKSGTGEGADKKTLERVEQSARERFSVLQFFQLGRGLSNKRLLSGLMGGGVGDEGAAVGGVALSIVVDEAGADLCFRAGLRGRIGNGDGLRRLGRSQGRSRWSDSGGLRPRSGVWICAGQGRGWIGLWSRLGRSS